MPQWVACSRQETCADSLQAWASTQVSACSPCRSIHCVHADVHWLLSNPFFATQRWLALRVHCSSAHGVWSSPRL